MNVIKMINIAHLSNINYKKEVCPDVNVKIIQSNRKCHTYWVTSKKVLFSNI